jgi:3-oxoacyl-(acyl-carrier-protein) synthase
LAGHTLGAAGISEAIICTLALKAQIAPGSINLQSPDEDLVNVLEKSKPKKLNHVLSNSFGFGGSNCALVFSC